MFFAIVTDETWVYWLDAWSHSRAPKGGGTIRGPDRHRRRAVHLVLAGDYVYFTNVPQRRIERIHRSGRPDRSGHAASTDQWRDVQDFVVDGPRVTWIDGLRLLRCETMPCSASTEIPLGTGLHPSALATFGSTSSVPYLVEESQFPGQLRPGGITVPREGGQLAIMPLMYTGVVGDDEPKSAQLTAVFGGERSPHRARRLAGRPRPQGPRLGRRYGHVPVRHAARRSYATAEPRLELVGDKKVTPGIVMRVKKDGTGQPEKSSPRTILCMACASAATPSSSPRTAAACCRSPAPRTVRCPDREGRSFFVTDVAGCRETPGPCSNSALLFALPLRFHPHAPRRGRGHRAPLRPPRPPRRRPQRTRTIRARTSPPLELMVRPTLGGAGGSSLVHLDPSIPGNTSKVFNGTASPYGASFGVGAEIGFRLPSGDRRRAPRRSLEGVGHRAQRWHYRAVAQSPERRPLLPWVSAGAHAFGAQTHRSLVRHCAVYMHDTQSYNVPAATSTGGTVDSSVKLTHHGVGSARDRRRLPDHAGHLRRLPSSTRSWCRSRAARRSRPRATRATRSAPGEQRLEQGGHRGLHRLVDRRSRPALHAGLRRARLAQRGTHVCGVSCVHARHETPSFLRRAGPRQRGLALASRGPPSSFDVPSRSLFMTVSTRSSISSFAAVALAVFLGACASSSDSGGAAGGPVIDSLDVPATTTSMTLARTDRAGRHPHAHRARRRLGPHRVARPLRGDESRSPDHAPQRADHRHRPEDRARDPGSAQRCARGHLPPRGREGTLERSGQRTPSRFRERPNA